MSLLPAPAQAASLSEVTGFGTNPGGLRMFRYAPDGLPAGRPLVVALHGCTQSAAAYDDETGWTRWAEAVRDRRRVCAGRERLRLLLDRPHLGTRRSGRRRHASRTVRTGGHRDRGSSVSPVWGAVEGAASYRVLRDGAVAGTSPSTSFTGSGLSPGTTYAYSVSAVDGAGAAGAPSAPVQVTTTEAPNACHTDNTYNHVAAGRAHQVQGTVYANGSGQNMGLYDLYVTHTLEETSPGYFVIADSGCPS
ncbi:fibronectin type III domain-containing protein [Streptomyces sp. I6]|uniref:fibronectin type III domain-containing protein n=1 Tax=Streptomyces sp. I6 TaxID=2483113 RepID=UPI0037DA4651